MCVRCVGFVLLVWFPGVLHAQSAALPCGAPRLNGGYFVPEQETYSHDSELTYACDNGHKPAVEGWWATSTCLNGIWSHIPQCIDEGACILPEIPNAKYTENPKGWYKKDQMIRITCDQGYEPKNRGVTARCINGTWFSVPVCEKSIQACGEPPKIPHAVIIHQEYKEVFAVDSEVQYECEDGYTAEGADSKKSIICIAGNWTEGPSCSRGTKPGTGHGGSTEGGTGGGHTTSAGSGTQPAGGGGGTGSGTGHGGSTEGGTGGGHTTSAGSGTQSVGGGSSTTSGSNDRDGRPMLISIDHCGSYPIVLNGDVVKVERMFVKYQCNAFYTLVGSDTVQCYGDGSWSQLPICKDTSCVLNPAQYNWSNFKLSGVEYLKESESKYLQCTHPDYFILFKCTNGRITFTQCCHIYDINRGVCR